MSGEPLPDLTPLLGRAEWPADLGPLDAWLGERRVLVTGAAGSIGSALAETLAALGRGRRGALLLLDHHEHTLFALARQLGARGLEAEYLLANVRDRRRLEAVFRRARPEVVLHLAALKHVPFGERFPEETVATNVLATRSLLDLAEAYGVEAFVYPSSDKAVHPPSLYGATKRIAEALVQRAAARSGHRFAAVRYVNILGTRGSVIETFAAQLRAGRPLTVTDLRMTRYWMTMREAVWLLAQAAGRAEPGALWLLAGLRERPIAETARDLARLLCPGQPPPELVVTGARPGERLREALLSEHEVGAPGPHPGILVVGRRVPAALGLVGDAVAELERLVEAGDGAELMRVAMVTAERLQ